MEMSWVCHTITLSHMLGRRERSLRKLKEGERVVDLTSKKNLSSFVFLGLRIKVLSQKKTLGSASHKKTSFVVKAASAPPVKQGANRPLCDRRDQHTLEKLQTELVGKINELKERTNYYTTQQLIQRYDPDPAAKAAAATVLASKLGAESGLKVFVRDESQLDPTAGKSNDMEDKHSQGLRNRKQPNTKRNTAGTTPAHHSDNESNHSGTSERMTSTEQNQQMVFEHYDPQAYAAHDGSWISRIAALLVGEDPTQSYALICGNCRMHNGLARKEDFAYITYYCPHCHALNKPKHSEEHGDALHTVSLKPMEREVINSSSSTSGRGNSPVSLLNTPEIVEEAPETAKSETPN